MELLEMNLKIHESKDQSEQNPLNISNVNNKPNSREVFGVRSC